MHWAVHLEAPQVLELLLERGANLEIRTEKEKNPERAKSNLAKLGITQQDRESLKGG